MNFDKLMNSRINWIADWIIRIVVINILVIVTMLPIITWYPAFVAGYSVFADTLDNKDVKLFRSFFRHFRTNLPRRLLFGVVVFLLTYLGFANSSYYSTLIEAGEGWFYQAGYFVTIVLLAMLYAVILYTFVVVYVLPSIKFKPLVKLSLYLAGKYYFITIFLVLLNMIPILMLFTSVTSVLFVFSGVSLPLLTHAILTQSARRYIEKIGADA
jgi:uncharacterized membrane protein YesL